jgi:dTDP-4-amino-4,6-dideoxygalactose transaminase
MIIPFCKSPTAPNSEAYIKKALLCKTGGDGEFTKKCCAWLEERFVSEKALLTTSCSHALDMTAYLLEIKDGDEVIIPSFTFPSTANAFVSRGAKIVFVDIRPDTMNINETLIEAAITNKTRVIVPVHYAGVACEMDVINEIAKKHNLFVVEDAAQGVMSEYKGKSLGTLGDFGCFSFHDTKNYSMGEGGALLIRARENIEAAEIIREKGTNRSRFYRGEVDKYSWVDWGSSYLPSDINAAYLYSQLEIADEINNSRLGIWNKYYELLNPLAEKGLLELPYIPENCRHNAHIFYIKTADSAIQSELIAFLNYAGIRAVFHYVPLHSSEAGQKFGRFHGKDKFTTKESSRLIRLPLYYGLPESDIFIVVKNINKFFGG